MPRALPGAVGALLAIAVVVPAPLASAQVFSRLFRGQQTPVWKARPEENILFSEEQQRLAEMKVELALLGDIATFPYYLSAHANGKTLVLHGYVPNDMVRQRAMDLARSNTFLRGIDELRIQPNLSVRSPLRPPHMLQQEGAELLQKELGEPAKQITVAAQPNGVIVLTGRTDSVQSKLDISRLFLRLSGCTAVLNELTVEQSVLDGQRVVRVMRNGSLFVSPLALGVKPEPLNASPPAGLPEKVMPQPASQQPAILPPPPLPTSSLDAREGELRLPGGNDWEAFAPSKLPVKWGRPASSWESQMKQLETAQASPTPAAPQAAHQQVPTPPQPLPKPADFVWTPQPVRSEDKIPTPIRVASRPAESKKGQASAAASKPSRASTSSHPNFAETREESAMTWRRPGGNEESEPKSPVPTKDQDDSAKPLPPPPPATPSLRSSRRWPPAYVTGPPPSQGRAGVIVFDDDSPPPKLAPAAIATSRPIVAADLQRQIKSLCGRQARAVEAAVQHDGSVLVKVKVANRSIEDRLTRKILSLPDMNSPRVRLLMEIEP